ITRSIMSWPSQSGQLDRTAADGFALSSNMARLPAPLDDHGSLVEIVDADLAVVDRSVLVGPGKADFKLRKGDAVDDDRLNIIPPDPGVPKAFSGLESLDLKAVVIHLAFPGCL